jgi:hypothetical protein
MDLAAAFDMAFEAPLNMTGSVFCLESSSKSSFNLAIGSILTVGACISYLPQHFAVLRSRSVKGMRYVCVARHCVAFR